MSRVTPWTLLVELSVPPALPAGFGNRFAAGSGGEWGNSNNDLFAVIIMAPPMNIHGCFS